MTSRIFDDYTPISSIDELEEIKRQKAEQEEKDAAFREQRKKDEALFGMKRVTGRTIGLAETLSNVVGYEETPHEVPQEAIQAAVSESVAKLNGLATGETKAAPVAPTADIAAFKSGVGSDVIESNMDEQDILMNAERYFENNNVSGKEARAKWISDNPQDFLMKVFPNKWNDLQDEVARQKYVAKIMKDREIERKMDDDYGWVAEGIDWLQVPENAILTATEVAVTIPSLGGATVLGAMGRRILFDGAIAATFEGTQAQQRYDTGIITADESLTDIAVVGGLGGVIGGGAEGLIRWTGLRKRMSSAAAWIFRNNKNIKNLQKADEAAAKQKAVTESVDNIADDVPGEVPNVVEGSDAAWAELDTLQKLREEGGNVADKLLNNELLRGINKDVVSIKQGRLDEVKNPNNLIIEKVDEIKSGDETMYKVKMKGTSGDETLTKTQYDDLQNVISTKKVEPGKKKLTQKQVGAIKMREKMRMKREKLKMAKAAKVKAADENKKKISEAVSAW